MSNIPFLEDDSQWNKNRNMFMGCGTMLSRQKLLAATMKAETAMTKEEMQKAMEFIVNQQTQASAQIDGILEAQREAQKEARKMDAHEER